MVIRVLGIDPGLTRCGIGVVEGPSGAPTAVAAEVARSDPHAPIEQRLELLHRLVAAALERHRPDVVACERVLFSTNARTAMGVGQAAGVALLAAAQAGIPVASYSPNEVKSSIAGDGAATKDAVARMVAAQLRLTSIPGPPDVADALAVALCHLSRVGLAVASPQRASGPAPSSWEQMLRDRPHLRQIGGTPGPAVAG